MPSDEIDQPFDSIESAYDFLTVLADTVLISIRELHAQHELALHEGQTRRARAIELALFKAKNLNSCVCKGRRSLNDLRTIRRLILNERMAPEAVVASMQGL